MHIQSINQNFAVKNKQNQKEKNNILFQHFIKMENRASLKRGNSFRLQLTVLKSNISNLLKRCINYENITKKEMSPKVIITNEYVYTDEHADKAFKYLKTLFAKEPEPTSFGEEKNIVDTFSKNKENIDLFMLKDENNVLQIDVTDFDNQNRIASSSSRKIQETDLALRH